MSRAASGAALLSALVRTPQATWPSPTSPSSSPAPDSEADASGALVAVAEALVGGDLSRLPLPPSWGANGVPATEAQVYASAAWMQVGEWSRLCAEVHARVTLGRLAHAYRVALLAAQLAYAAGLDTRRAFAAGVLHDIARDLPEAELLRLAPPQCRNEATHPLALHGRAARALLESLGFGDAAVLRAVEEHVTGPQITGLQATGPQAAAGISGLSVCVYIADVSEPARGVNDQIRAAAFRDLLSALRAAIASKVSYLQGRGLEVHPATLSLHRQLERGAALPQAWAGAAGAGIQRAGMQSVGVQSAGMSADMRGAGANW